MKKREAIARALPWLVLAAAYALSVAFIARCGMHNLNADDASEMVLASLLNREGALLSRNWLYSSELRLLSPVPLYQLGLLLFPGSWHAARTFAIAIVMLLIAAAMLYALGGLGLRRCAPWLTAVFMLPFSQPYAYIILYECYYSMHFVLSLVMLGLLCRVSRVGLRRGKGSTALLVLLGLLGGLNGVRMLTSFIVPAAAAGALLAAGEMRRHARCREAVHTQAVRLGAAGVLTALAAGVGYLANMKGLSRVYQYATYGDMVFTEFRLDDFWHQFDGIVQSFGYRANAPFFSPQGVACLVALALTAAVALSCVVLARSFGDLPAEHRLLLLTAVLAIALGMVLNVLLSQYMTRYFFIGILLLILVLAAALERGLCVNSTLRRGAWALLAGCFLFQTTCAMRYDYTQGEVNYEMAADWLLENGYTQGYATFWNANLLTEASDGQIEMWVLSDRGEAEWTGMKLHTMLQEASHLTRDPQGRVFLLVDEIENQADAPLLDEGHLVGELVGWSYYVYGYESVDEMRALIGGGQ